MTSPLSSLRKTKKTPLLRPAPFRPSFDLASLASSDVSDFSIFDENVPSDCAELVNDVTTSDRKKKSTTRALGAKASPAQDDKSIPSDMDLMSSMMSRLSQLQLRLQFHEKELAEKDRTIKTLQRKVDQNQTPVDKNLEGENRRLRHQVYQMEEFLSDYGMIWVGSDDSDSEPVISTVRPSIWEPKKSLDFCADYDAIIQNIKDLNILAGEGVTQIQRTADGATLKLQDPIQLSLYQNGILMFNGPFRPFTDLMTQQCAQDLMDGYFPTELQKRYPDGVLFSVHDHRHKRYEEKEVFSGEGRTLGGEVKTSSRLVRPETHVKTVSTDTFLSKLPSSVVKQGRVIDIRHAVSDVILGEASISVVRTSVVEDLRKSAKGSRISELSGECSTLRIKHGDKTFVLLMNASETLRDVRRNLHVHCPSLAKLQYELWTSFPRKVFEDDSATLLESGLMPNATLHLHVKK